MVAQFDDLVATMVAEQAERDGLRASVEAETQRADREHAAAEAADQARRAAEATLADRDALIVQLRARIAELEAGDDPDPEPRRTLFGSCPAYPGGESLTAARTVTNKWGAGAAVRQFKGNLSAPNQVGSITHTSYKPAITDLLAGRLDSAIGTVVAGCRAGDVLEVWHEADKKVTDGVDTYERLVAAKNYFYVKAKALRPDVLIANTLTGWLMEPTRSPQPDWRRWGAVKADVVGIDCDGVHPTRLPYTDYQGESARARAFVDEFAGNGYRWYAVPEYGCGRMAIDPDGIERAKAYRAQADRWAADPLCLFVTLYEYDGFGQPYALTTPAELAAWGPLIGG